jgi:hypothetical protein
VRASAAQTFGAHYRPSFTFEVGSET